MLAAVMAGCHEAPEYKDDPYGNFDALAAIVGERYCFFEEKGIDWEKLCRQYRAEIKPDMNQLELFDICSRLLDELQDGHVNLSSRFNTSYYRKWWSDYPQNFNLRIIQENYLGFDYHSGGGIIYKLLEDRKVGYMRYSSFAAGFGESFVDDMLYSMREADGLVIDVRDNGGGDMTNVEKLVAHFINEPVLAGYISHKTGPGHNDFSEPYPFTYEPAVKHVRWLKPVVVLTNRSTFSAANTFVSVMKYLPHVVIAGATTGGGCGMPFSSEIPCGWSVRFSSCPVYDAEMNLTEHGVEPTKGAEVEMDPEAEARGVDTMLEFAIALLNSTAEDIPNPAP